MSINFIVFALILNYIINETYTILSGLAQQKNIALGSSIAFDNKLKINA